MQTWYDIQNKAGRNTVSIHDLIGSFGVSAKDFISELSKIKGPVDLHISSSGGSVFEGLSIANTIYQRGNVTVHVDGVAASIASVIAVSGTKLVMPSNTFLMIHDPSGTVSGGAKDLRKVATTLDKVQDTLAGTYQKKSGLSKAEILKMMNAETWLTAAEAKKKGFADEVTGAIEITNHLDLSEFSQAPAQLVASASSMSIKSREGKHKMDFNQLVDKAVSGGLSRVEAISQTVRDHPESHKAMLDESNPPKVPPEARESARRTALCVWNQLIDRLVASGMSKAEAVKSATHSHEHLHHAAFYTQ